MSATPSLLTPMVAVEARRFERTDLILDAVLHSKAGPWPVHIRNISPAGALIDGAVVPELGETLVLKRARLQVAARVAWKVGGRAGIAFSSMIHVADWMSRRTSPHQGRVDEIVQDIRSRGGDCRGGSRANAESPDFAGDLRALKDNLAELEKCLVGDVVVVATHPEIQLLDVAMHRVERMLASLARRPPGPQGQFSSGEPDQSCRREDASWRPGPR